MTEFVWNICLLRLHVGHTVWRLRLGKAKPTADPMGWHKLAGHLYVCVFGVEGGALETCVSHCETDGQLKSYLVS